MKCINKMIVIFLPILFIGATLYGQDLETQLKQQADSLQRITMKDSLDITDDLVNQIFAARDNMIRMVHLKELNNPSGDSTGTTEIVRIRRQANKTIKQILGEEKYNHYTQMIRNRLNKNKNANQLPLAGETEND